jgi:2-polyprenyl-3-methyl-5-hydroxy-6-metoxy-1,4-benzoquinol methylase
MTTTPDGSPVDLYLLFPPAGEAERVHAAIDEGATVLDLGCGVGRIAHELIDLGHPVVAVDESREMLAHVRGAETVQAPIEDLDLGRRFPCVLLASHLVNTADAKRRRAFLETCARHVAGDGVVRGSSASSGIVARGSRRAYTPAHSRCVTSSAL